MKTRLNAGAWKSERGGTGLCGTGAECENRRSRFSPCPYCDAHLGKFDHSFLEVCSWTAKLYFSELVSRSLTTPLLVSVKIVFPMIDDCCICGLRLHLIIVFWSRRGNGFKCGCFFSAVYQLEYKWPNQDLILIQGGRRKNILQSLARF